jgi:hypothetical protein
MFEPTSLMSLQATAEQFRTLSRNLAKAVRNTSLQAHDKAVWVSYTIPIFGPKSVLRQSSKGLPRALVVPVGNFSGLMELAQGATKQLEDMA